MPIPPSRRDRRSAHNTSESTTSVQVVACVDTTHRVMTTTRDAPGQAYLGNQEVSHAPDCVQKWIQCVPDASGS